MIDVKPLIFQFDSIQVDPQTFKVVKDGTALPIEPKAFEVLVFLLTHRGRLVEKDELLEALWPDSFVTPNALTRVIAQLRKTLGDDAKGSHYIETVPTRGYRFIAEVTVEESAGEKEKGAEKKRQVEDGRLLTSPHHPIASSPRRSFVFPLSLALLLLLLGLIGWQVRQRFISSDWPSVARTVQLTASPLMDVDPAFSPDGGTIAYSGLRQESFELYVKPLSPGSREIQVTADGAQNRHPSWSPDGKLLAYHSRKQGGIWVVPAFGGVARQLVEFGAKPAWSPNGEWIVFQSESPNDSSPTAYTAFAPSTLWIVAAKGGIARPLTTKAKPMGGHGAPAWSPDGKRIVFVTYQLNKSEVWTIAPDGNDLTLLSSEYLNYFDPIYAPDGKYLYLSTGGGNFKIWRRQIAPETGLPIGEPVEVANTGAAVARHLTIAPDGKRIAYSSLQMNNNIGSVTVSPQTFEATGAPVLLTQDTHRRKTASHFSPDGKTIAYSVWRTGAGGELWLMNADGTGPRQLTADLAGLPNWLPGGNQIAVVAKNVEEQRMFAVDVKSGKQTILSEQRFPIALGKLSPDGTEFAFNSNTDGSINIATLPLAGGAVKQLTFDRELMGFPCWSRDSRFLAFEVKRGEHTNIAVMPRAGGTPEFITSELGQSWPGGWAMDGDKIAFAGLRNSLWNVYWVSRSTKAQKQLTNFTKPNTYVRYPVWSPLSNQVIYEFGETTGNVWMLELK